MAKFNKQQNKVLKFTNNRLSEINLIKYISIFNTILIIGTNVLIWYCWKGF